VNRKKGIFSAIWLGLIANISYAALSGLDISEGAYSEYDMFTGIEYYSELNDVDPAFVASVLMIESDANPCAKSNAGAAGLMQLMPGTAQEMGVVDRFNPEQSIAGGTAYLKYALKLSRGNIYLAAAIYNYGPRARTRNVESLPDETLHYVKKIYERYQRFENGQWKLRLANKRYINRTNTRTCIAEQSIRFLYEDDILENQLLELLE